MSEIVSNNFVESKSDIDDVSIMGFGKLVIACPPSRRSIIRGNKIYFLSFPRMLFSFSYSKVKNSKDKRKIEYTCNSLRVAFTDYKNTLYLPALHNIFFDTIEVCLGDNFIDDEFDYDEVYRFNSLDKMTKNILSIFWQAPFNNDVADTGYTIYRDTGGMLLGDYQKWQEKTKSNPLWVPETLDFCYPMCYHENTLQKDFFGNQK